MNRKFVISAVIGILIGVFLFLGLLILDLKSGETNPSVSGSGTPVVLFLLFFNLFLGLVVALIVIIRRYYS